MDLLRLFPFMFFGMALYDLAKFLFDCGGVKRLQTMGVEISIAVILLIIYYAKLHKQMNNGVKK